jgi:copper transport protein
MVAVAALAVTGTYQAWREIGALPALTGTTYGRLVLGKVACLTVLLVLGDQSRRWVQRHVAGERILPRPAPLAVGAAVGGSRPATPGQSGPSTNQEDVTAAGPTTPKTHQLRRTVVAEVAVAAVVLGLTTLLVNTVPGRQAYAPPFSATVTGQGNNGESITVLLDVDSTQVGATTVHLYTYTKVGAVLPFSAATGTLVERAKGLGPVRFSFTVLAPGHGTASQVIVPAPGRWTLTVQVQTDATTDYAATATYPVQ